MKILYEIGSNTKRSAKKMGKILSYIVDTIPYMLLSVPFILLIRVIFLSVKKKKYPMNLYHEIGFLVFIMFCVGVASQTMIPKIEFGATFGIVNGNLSGEVNLIPGKVFIDMYDEWTKNNNILYFSINFVGNICLFLPIGFGIMLLWNQMTFKKIVFISLCLSFIIELCQLPQARETDIDDLWVRVSGAIIGYLIYIILSKNKTTLKLLNKFKYN